MELVPEPDQDKIYDNVAFIDEYPDLAKKVWLRRLAQERAGKLATTDIIIFPDRSPDGAA